MQPLLREYSYKNTCQPPPPGYVTDDIYSVIAPPTQ